MGNKTGYLYFVCLETYFKTILLRPKFLEFKQEIAQLDYEKQLFSKVVISTLVLQYFSRLLQRMRLLLFFLLLCASLKMCSGFVPLVRVVALHHVEVDVVLDNLRVVDLVKSRFLHVVPSVVQAVHSRARVLNVRLDLLLGKVLHVRVN